MNQTISCKTPEQCRVNKEDKCIKMVKENENANHHRAKLMADEDLRDLSKKRNNTFFDCTTGFNNLEDII